MDTEKLLTDLEKAHLYKYVHLSIKALISNLPASVPKSRLNEKKQGIFITLLTEGRKRGCFGNPYPQEPLVETIQNLLDEGALEDPRFPPLTLADLSQLQIELSLLTHPEPITANEIEIGTHGLIFKYKDHKSLFLPKVPLEENWTVQALLENLCLKAHLDKDTWQKGGQLFAFQASQTFCEENI